MERIIGVIWIYGDLMLCSSGHGALKLRDKRLLGFVDERLCGFLKGHTFSGSNAEASQDELQEPWAAVSPILQLQFTAVYSCLHSKNPKLSLQP